YFDQFESLISIHGEYGVIHPQQARQSLSIFLQNLQERNDFCAVPDGYRDRDEFFDNMIKHLRIITHILSEGNASNYTKNEVFQSLVSASGQCGGRYAGEVINAYQIATETIVAEDVPGKIYEVLHKARNGFIEDVIREHHGNIDDIFHVHAVTTYKKLLGEVRGIRGWSVASYEDPYAQCIGFSTAKAYFDAKYTKSFIINRIFGWLNGIPSDDNPTIRIARDCSNVNEIIDWFKDHIPENFEPEVPITEEMILEEQTSLLMSGELDAVPYERAIESCKKIAFLREFVYDEDAIIIREEAVIYMLRRMEVLV
ncbi:MAG: hypothetical protein KAR79_01520, partial [Simkaniaceae bacterium]|nr:hypothetical protein [Simkaniaceae bacterium]